VLLAALRSHQPSLQRLAAEALSILLRLGPDEHLHRVLLLLLDPPAPHPHPPPAIISGSILRPVTSAAGAPAGAPLFLSPSFLALLVQKSRY
jgi:hypothetical protein